MGVCAEFKTNASSVTARVKRDKMALISLTLAITDLEHLHAQNLISTQEALNHATNLEDLGTFTEETIVIKTKEKKDEGNLLIDKESINNPSIQEYLLRWRSRTTTR